MCTHTVRISKILSRKYPDIAAVVLQGIEMVSCLTLVHICIVFHEMVTYMYEIMGNCNREMTTQEKINTN